MTKIKIQTDLIACTTVEIGDRIKLILKIFPEDEEVQTLLKHPASASLHIAFFMRDIYDYVEGNETNKISNEEQFLNDCGCK